MKRYAILSQITSVTDRRTGKQNGVKQLSDIL